MSCGLGIHSSEPATPCAELESPGEDIPLPGLGDKAVILAFSDELLLPLGTDSSGVDAYCPLEPEDTNVRPELMEFGAPEDDEPDASDGEDTPDGYAPSCDTGGGYRGLKLSLSSSNSRTINPSGWWSSGPGVGEGATPLSEAVKWGL